MNPSPVIDSERAAAQGQPSADASRAGPAGFADLHLHTLFSDGTFTPEELADRGGRETDAGGSVSQTGHRAC